MNKYNEAFKFANMCLSSNDSLTDFNTLKLTSRPISASILSEEIFRSALSSTTVSLKSQRRVDSTFFKSYENNDLRSKVFYLTASGRTYASGSYDTKNNLDYSGLANDEMYLIRAECYARNGQTALALKDLNKLLRARWRTGSYIDYYTDNSSEVLAKVLSERRKELVFRGLRWTDLRRLNEDPRFALTLKRTVNNTTYILHPKDLRYVLPIPDNEIQSSGIQQNPR